MKKLKDIPAIILAGGLGKRIKSATSDIPKPLIKVGGCNLIEHNIFNLKKAGVKGVVISLGYKGEMIKEYFGNGKKYGLRINYIKDPYLLGDAGAFKYAYDRIAGTVILANSDEIREGLNLEEMLEFHIKKKALSTMAVIEQQDITNHGIVEVNKMEKITSFMMNPSFKETNSCYANSGLYLMEKKILTYFPDGHSMMEAILEKIVNSKKAYAFIFEGAYFNVGTPEILKKANKYFDGLKQI
ncbi:MAG: nucleotidyltransferase family protein [Nanoarchaeota archaeon]|nr:nucleotidyltransferase family protein [Nanoarchaeota archaeon]